LGKAISMLFSKSFGYAVRSVLYIASVQNEKQYVQLEEISSKLHLPKQFMGRILKNLAKEKILTSIKGPKGGFGISKEGLQTPLARILEVTDGNQLGNCVIKKKNCNPLNPCPVHNDFSKIRADLIQLMSGLIIAKLVKGDHAEFVKSLSEINGKTSRKNSSK
jgi:Rrf2 family transcriptional regulator, iron-sulfur cluster assembly transcription factor